MLLVRCPFSFMPSADDIYSSSACSVTAGLVHEDIIVDGKVLVVLRQIKAISFCEVHRHMEGEGNS